MSITCQMLQEGVCSNKLVTSYTTPHRYENRILVLSWSHTWELVIQ